MARRPTGEKAGGSCRVTAGASSFFPPTGRLHGRRRLAGPARGLTAFSPRVDPEHEPGPAVGAGCRRASKAR